MHMRPCTTDTTNNMIKKINHSDHHSSSSPSTMKSSSSSSSSSSSTKNRYANILKSKYLRDNTCVLQAALFINGSPSGAAAKKAILVRWTLLGLVVLSLYSMVSFVSSGHNRQQPNLVMLPILPFYSCWGGFQKTVCNTTFLVEDSDVIPLPQATDDAAAKFVCDYLWKSGGTFAAAHAPVCIQNSNTLGLLAHYDIPANLDRQQVKKRRRVLYQSLKRSGNKILRIIDNPNDEKIINFFKYQLNGRGYRKLRLKHIDFPTTYRGVDDVNNWKWDQARDENYGNMVWRYASSMMLNPASTEVDLSDTWVNPKLTNGPAEVLVIASANTLHLTTEPQLEGLINNITERVKLRNIPTIVLGIGIQFEFNDASKNFNLNRTDLALYHDFQKTFLKEVSLRQKRPAIGVRGDMTKAICENSGIKNCVSMGCPSLTISRDANLGVTLLENWSKFVRKLAAGATDLRIAVTFPAYGGSDSSSFTAVEFICSVLEQYGSQVTVILQDTQDRGRMEEFLADNWKQMKPESKLQSSDIRYEEYYNVESWLAAARTKYDICLSSRIHGSMTFISSGIPAVVIPTDFRIFELIHAMKIPHILPDELSSIMHSGVTHNKMLMAVMDKAKNTNFIEFEKNRRAKILGWKSILDQVGLDMDPALLNVVRTPIE